MKGILLFQVFGQGTIGVGPGTEIVDFAPNLFAPIPGRVGSEGVFRVRFGGLASDGGWSRIRLGHGDTSLPQSCCVSLAEVVTTHLGHFHIIGVVQPVVKGWRTRKVK
jgi:hypothetical protein